MLLLWLIELRVAEALVEVMEGTTEKEFTAVDSRSVGIIVDAPIMIDDVFNA